MSRFEVVVIGAGLAGLWCGQALARRGVRVLLVDAKPSVDEVVRTSGIFVRRTVEEFELPTGSLRRPIRHVILYSPGRRKIELESRRDEFFVADMRALYRALLAQCLGLGVTWWPSTRYSGIQRLERSLLVRLGTTDVQTRFIVGADGARSKVARDLRLSRNRHFLIGIEDVYEDTTAAAPSTLHCFLDCRLAPGYIAWIIHDDTHAHVGTAGISGRYYARGALDRFTTEAASMLDLAKESQVETRAGLIPVGGLLPHIACSRGLLVGDAAGGPSPLTAGGLDPCLRLSEQAAYALTQSMVRRTNLCDAYDGRRASLAHTSRLFLRSLLRHANQGALELAHAAMRSPFCVPIPNNIFFGLHDSSAASPAPASVFKPLPAWKKRQSAPDSVL